MTKRIKNLKTHNEFTKIIDTVVIYVPKLLITPHFKRYKKGWFFSPNTPHKPQTDKKRIIRTFLIV
jgi:hypothetical protein